MGGLFALISASVGGTTPILLKPVSSKYSVFQINFLKLLSALFVMALPIFFFSGDAVFSLSPKVILLALLTSLAGPFIAWSSYIRAIRETDVSVAHPIINIYPLFSVLLDYIFFSVIPSPVKVGGFLLILFALRLFFFEKVYGIKKGTLFAILVSVLWGVNSFLYKIILTDTSPFILTFLRLLFAVVFLYVYLKILKIEVFKFSFSELKFPVSAGISNDIIGLFFFFKAIEIGPLYVVLPLAATSPFVSGALSYLILKEKFNFRRILSIFLTVTGVVLLLI